MALYDVYIINELDSDEQVAKAAALLAAKFKLTPEQAQKLLNKERAIIKRAVDEATAKKLEAAIVDCGLQAELVDDTSVVELELADNLPEANGESKHANSDSAGKHDTAGNIYQAPAAPVGKQVFCRQCGSQMSVEQRVCTNCGASIVVGGGRSKVVAGFLAFFLGGFGIHRFYLGQWWGIFYIPFYFLFFLSSLVSLVEAIYFWACSKERWDEKYGDKPANSGLIIALIAVVPIIAVVGILAAVAVPAYQDYTYRAKVAAGLNEAHAWKMAVEEFAISTNFIPNSTLDAGIKLKVNNPHLDSIEVVDEGEIVLTFIPFASNNERHTITLIPTFTKSNGKYTSATWDCKGGTLPNNYRPVACRNTNLPAFESARTDHDTKVVKSPYTGLQLTIPAKWKEGAADNDEASINYGDIYSEAYLLVFEELDNANVFADLDAFHQQVQNMYLEDLPNAVLTGSGPLTTLNQEQGRFSRLKANVDGYDIVYIVVAFNRGDTYFQLVLWTLESRAGKNEKVLKQIAKSAVLP